MQNLGWICFGGFGVLLGKNSGSALEGRRMEMLWRMEMLYLNKRISE